MKVLVAVDGSDIAEKSFDWYFEKVHRPENEVIVLSNADAPTLLGTVAQSTGAAFPGAKTEQMSADQDRKASKIEVKYTEKLNQRTKNGRVVMDSSDDKPGKVIVDTAEQYDVHLIVIGARGLGALKRTFLGSVSNYVVNNCKRPVVVYRRSGK